MERPVKTIRHCPTCHFPHSFTARHYPLRKNPRPCYEGETVHDWQSDRPCGHVSTTAELDERRSSSRPAGTTLTAAASCCAATVAGSRTTPSRWRRRTFSLVAASLQPITYWKGPPEEAEDDADEEARAR